MLALKLALVPMSLLLVSLAGIKWGPRVGGLLSGLPVIVGPILLLLTLEQGAAFAQATATSSLAAVAALAVFSVAYARAARNWSWRLALIVSLAGWAVTALLLTMVSLTPVVSLVIALATIAVTYAWLPTPSASIASRPPRADSIAIRMAAGAVLTLAVTAVADVVGSKGSGLIALFPVLGVTLAVGTHRDSGTDHVIAFMGGVFWGLLSLSSFLFVFALRVGSGLAGAFALGIAAAMAIQIVVSQWVLTGRFRRT